MPRGLKVNRLQAAITLCVIKFSPGQPTSHVGDLQQHGGDKVDALQQLQVDVHVVGQQATLLNLLLLWGTLMLPLRHQALHNQRNASFACKFANHV